MNNMKLDKIKELVQLIKDEDLQEIELKDGDKSIRIEAKRPQVTSEIIPQSNVQAGVSNGNNSIDGNSRDDELLEIRAPQIGVFYTQKAEESEETFVEVGDTVDKETQVGMIEAMKMFNDIFAEHDGVVEEILVSNGESVEYNQVLMLIRPKEA